MILEGRVTLITGAGSGIGAETARLFAAEGAKLLLVDRATDSVRQVAAEIGDAARAHICDITDELAVQSLVREAGRIDILINNAGIIQDKSALKMTGDVWRQVIDVNLSGSFYVAQAVGAVMKENGFGRIVNTTSTSAWGKFGQANYAASKMGIVGLTRTLAIEWARYGITVNAIAPGFIETEMTAVMPADVREASFAAIPVGRNGQPIDIARTHLFLASPESSFITGQVLVVDGGMKLVR